MKLFIALFFFLLSAASSRSLGRRPWQMFIDHFHASTNGTHANISFNVSTFKNLGVGDLAPTHGIQTHCEYNKGFNGTLLPDVYNMPCQDQKSKFTFASPSSQGDNPPSYGLVVHCDSAHYWESTVQRIEWEASNFTTHPVEKGGKPLHFYTGKTVFVMPDLISL